MVAHRRVGGAPVHIHIVLGALGWRLLCGCQRHSGMSLRRRRRGTLMTVAPIRVDDRSQLLVLFRLGVLLLSVLVICTCRKAGGHGQKLLCPLAGRSSWICQWTKPCCGKCFLIAGRSGVALFWVVGASLHFACFDACARQGTTVAPMVLSRRLLIHEYHCWNRLAVAHR